MKKDLFSDPNICEPYFCRDASDFAMVTFACTIDDDVTGIKILCHEYLALLLQGKINPYTSAAPPTEAEKKDFREFCTNTLAKFPDLVKEDKDGSVRLDFDKIARLSGSNCTLPSEEK